MLVELSNGKTLNVYNLTELVVYYNALLPVEGVRVNKGLRLNKKELDWLYSIDYNTDFKAHGLKYLSKEKVQMAVVIASHKLSELINGIGLTIKRYQWNSYNTLDERIIHNSLVSMIKEYEVGLPIYNGIVAKVKK